VDETKFMAASFRRDCSSLGGEMRKKEEGGQELLCVTKGATGGTIYLYLLGREIWGRSEWKGRKKTLAAGGGRRSRAPRSAGRKGGGSG